MWPLFLIADAAADALQRRDAALREEQAVYGLDALPELDFHPIIADGLSLGSGFGVLREQPYPHEWFRKLRVPVPEKARQGLALPLPRDRQRCDLVLTPEPSQTLDDALNSEKQRRAEELELQGTLFESPSTSHLAPGTTSSPFTSDIPHPTSHIPPESAFWLELKLVGQYTNTSGYPGPNRTYTSELTRAPLTDLKKLADDHRIHHGGVLLIVFTADKTVADHDLTILAHRCLDKDLPLAGVGGAVTRSFPIPDRMGNTVCTVCLIGLRKVE